MPVYTIYLQQTGRILAQIIGRLTFGRERLGEGIYEGSLDPVNDYINPETNTAQPRPQMDLQITDDTIAVNEYFRVDNIPEGTTLHYPNDLEEVIDDGFFEWSTEFPGEYEFTLSNFPYKSVTVHATFS